MLGHFVEIDPLSDLVFQQRTNDVCFEFSKLHFLTSQR